MIKYFTPLTVERFSVDILIPRVRLSVILIVSKIRYCLLSLCSLFTLVSYTCYQYNEPTTGKRFSSRQEMIYIRLRKVYKISFFSTLLIIENSDEDLRYWRDFVTPLKLGYKETNKRNIKYDITYLYLLTKCISKQMNTSFHDKTIWDL